MKAGLIEVQDKFKSTLRFYEVKSSCTVVIDPNQIFDSNGYAVLYRPLDKAISYVRHMLIKSYLDGLTDPQEKSDALGWIYGFYKVII